MKMQEKIIEQTDLLDEKGELIQSGWATKLIANYNRENIKVNPYRIKEWDYYEITNPEFSLVLLIYDIGIFGEARIDWIDFGKKSSISKSVDIWNSRGSLNLPKTSETGDLEFNKGEYSMKFSHQDGIRILTFNFPNFDKERGFKGEIHIFQDQNMETMVNIIPFKKKKQFVYAQKINCMNVSGMVKFGDKEFVFSKENHSFACLDWSRGVLPYKTSWKWCSASCEIDGKSFGFNIDYGFGTESSKNMIFYQGKGYHLDEVKYQWDENDLNKPWKFTSNDNRVNMVLEPVYILSGNLNLILFRHTSHRAYGFFIGKIVLESGKIIQFNKNDRVFGFAEFDQYLW